jgi:hypothetical protein
VLVALPETGENFDKLRTANDAQHDEIVRLVIASKGAGNRPGKLLAVAVRPAIGSVSPYHRFAGVVMSEIEPPVSPRADVLALIGSERVIDRAYFARPLFGDHARLLTHGSRRREEKASNYFRGFGDYSGE